jgi:deoxyxylulose-5-phosphate synthase
LADVGAKTQVMALGIPKKFLEQKSRATWVKDLGIDAQGIKSAVTARLNLKVQ